MYRGILLLAVSLFVAPTISQPPLPGPPPPTTSSTKKWIISGAQWLDTDNQLINAHGGGITKFNNTFYWIGSGVGCCAGTNLYSSPDLVTWTNLGAVYDQGVSRPKLAWSEATATWNILGQVGRQLIVATSPNITGPYTTSPTTPLSPLGVNFTDFGLFTPGGFNSSNAYTLYSADHNNLVVSQLNPERTNVTSLVHQFSGVGLESPGMFQDSKGNYYVIGSHKSAYMPNNDVVYSSPDLVNGGTWSVQSYIAPFGTRTWNSQNTFELELGESFTMYMGDRWVYPDLPNSTYVWLPIKVDENSRSMSVEWVDVWEVDVEKGSWRAVEGTKYEAEDGVLEGGSVVSHCPTCSGMKVVSNISGARTLTFPNITIPPSPSSSNSTTSTHYISFHYINTDGLFGDLTIVDADSLAYVKQRNATVSINGAEEVVVPMYDSNAGIVMSVPLKVELNQGENSVKVGAVGTQMAGDIDYIVVY